MEIIRGIGPEQCIISTDFGQAYHPMPTERLRMGVATLLQAGMDEVGVVLMVKDNLSELLGR